MELWKAMKSVTKGLRTVTMHLMHAEETVGWLIVVMEFEIKVNSVILLQTARQPALWCASLASLLLLLLSTPPQPNLWTPTSSMLILVGFWLNKHNIFFLKWEWNEMVVIPPLFLSSSE